MMSRDKKRGVIIFIYFLIFGSFFSLIYYFLQPEPTCSDGIKNQLEEGIDCGNICQVACKKDINAQPIAVDEKYFVYGNKNQFDVMAEISNPNDKYGAFKFDYEFKLVDQANSVLAQKKGSNFILPGESKFIIEMNLQSAINPYTVNFEITNVQWDEFLDYEEPRLSIFRKNYTEEVGRGVATGLVRNESYFNFNSIEVDVVLRDKNGVPVALGKNEMRTINSQEERDFKLIWPYKFSEGVFNVDVKAEANIFDQYNFIKKELPSRQFQNYSY